MKRVECSIDRKSKIVSDKIGIVKDFRKNWGLYLMLFPVLVYFALFCYKPMYGVIIAFKDYSPVLGIMDSPWVGLKHFQSFICGRYFFRLMRNTLTISLSSLCFVFTAPIIFALLMNEIKNKPLKRTVQTVTYLPNFISLVVICGLVKEFTLDTGIINDIIEFFGGTRSTLLANKNAFVPIYIISEIWQTVGWNSIIYLAALTNIDVQLYDAAIIDGAGKWKQMLHVTLPGIAPTIVIMFIMKIGGLLTVGYEKIILLYNQNIYETADVISTFVYRKGIIDYDWSYSTAVGLFNSVINLI